MQKIVKAVLPLLSLVLACQPKQKVTESIPVSQIICRTEPTDKAWYSTNQKAPLFDSLGNIHFPISTQNKDVQRYFDQGLMLSAGFNHAEAARSFFEATRLDSSCAMAYWGFSYVLGPNYNAGMEPDNYERAYKAIQKAKQLSGSCTSKEKALIDALAKRYAPQPVDDRTPYDVAYTNAMKQVHQQFPDDADIAALYVESLMDQHPWDLWEKDGRPRPWTPEILATLENLLAKYPAHIALNHFYIHAVEASKTPERALKSADVLSKAAPNASHLVHMPSHIYIHTGHYQEGAVANQRAVNIDSIYLQGIYAQGVFPLSYFPHNYHFLAATATLAGNSHWAMQSAQKIAQNTKKKLMSDSSWSSLQHYYTIPYYVAAKFGKWDEILHMSDADTIQLKYPNAIRAYARGLAFVSKGQLTQAKQALQLVEKYAADPDMAKLTIWNINSMASLLEIAQRVLKAEILAKEGQLPASVTLLREAVALEDKLNYNEPPDWFFSVRHNLGNVLLKAKRYVEAETVFNEDLKQFPGNGWALAGLQKAQLGLGLTEKAKQTQTQLTQAWKWADKGIKSDPINGL